MNNDNQNLVNNNILSQQDKISNKRENTNDFGLLMNNNITKIEFLQN